MTQWMRQELVISNPNSWPTQFDLPTSCLVEQISPWQPVAIYPEIAATGKTLPLDMYTTAKAIIFVPAGQTVKITCLRVLQGRLA